MDPLELAARRRAVQKYLAGVLRDGLGELLKDVGDLLPDGLEPGDAEDAELSRICLALESGLVGDDPAYVTQDVATECRDMLARALYPEYNQGRRFGEADAPANTPNSLWALCRKAAEIIEAVREVYEDDR